MKKICLFLMAAMLLLSATAFSQESKSRTKLYEAHYNNYRIIHSVISPKGNIIVLTYGGVWYAKDENSPIERVFNFKDDYNTYYEGLHEILFFNADTILIVGDLVSHSIYHNPISLVSNNGGKTWKKHKINIIAIKHNDKMIMDITTNTQLSGMDRALVLGKDEDIQKCLKI